MESTPGEEQEADQEAFEQDQMAAMQQMQESTPGEMEDGMGMDPNEGQMDMDEE